MVWHGGDLGEGGVAGLEEREKSRWRRHWSSAEKKHFSNCKKVLTTAKKVANEGRKPVADVLEEWDVAYRSKRIDLSISKLVCWLIEEGSFVPGVARGRFAKRQTLAT